MTKSELANDILQTMKDLKNALDKEEKFFIEANCEILISQLKLFTKKVKEEREQK